MIVTHRLQLFGHVILQPAAQPAWHFPTRKSMALLGYLARQSHPVSRSELTNLLWGDLPEARSRRNLTRELSQLSAQLPNCFQADYHAIHWVPPTSVWVDTTAFLALLVPTVAAPQPSTPAKPAIRDPWFDHAGAAAIDSARLAAAVALYSGEFMDGLYLDGCPEFETWLLREREFWRRRVLEQLELLIAHHALHQHDLQAILFARRCLELEPWHEEAHRALMILLARGGNRAAALAQYDTCRRMLAAELTLEPASETTTLYEQIRAGNLDMETQRSGDTEVARPESGLVSRSPRLPVSRSSAQDWGSAPDVDRFYGRQAELATLERWLVDERCRVVALLGMGGVGKTVLASYLMRLVAPQYDAVIWCSLLNAPPLAEILRTCIPFLSDQQLDELPDRLDAQLALLLDLFGRRRCLLVLDNCESVLQAGARAGAYRPGYEDYGQLLQRVGESTHPSCLLLTSREQPYGFGLLYGDTTPVRALHLAGIGTDAGRQILRARGLADITERATGLVDRYSGNPLALQIVAETVNDLFGGDLAAFLHEEALIFDDIRDVLDQQWNRLTILEQNILLWLAIEREAITPEALRANLIDTGTLQVPLEALRSLRRRSLIEQHSAGFTLQNVVLEYATERLIAIICHELEQGDWNRFGSHALMKAQSKEYVRESQVRLILAPIAEWAVVRLGRIGLEQRLQTGLAALREQSPQTHSYAAGNALNLLLHCGCDLHSYDFSRLSVRQAYLQNARLPEINFAYANLAGSVFTDDFRSQDPLAWSPDGVLLAAAAGNGHVHVWGVAGLQLTGICAGHRGYIRALAFSPDSRLLASAGADATVRVWDLQSFQPIHTFRGHERGVSAVAWSTDGSTVISSSWDHTIRLWDVRTGQAGQILREHTDAVRCLALSHDGQRLASGADDRTVRVWDVASQHVLHTLTHPTWVITVAFSPDGAALASGCFNQTLWIWDIRSGIVKHALHGANDQVRCLAFSPDGAALASCGDALVRIWDPHTGQVRSTWHGHVPWTAAVAWSPDSTRLASLGGNSVRVWDIRDGRAVAGLHGHSDEVLSVAFNPDGATFASSHADNIIRIWDTASWNIRHTLHGHTNSITNLLFSPDGSTLISGSFDQTIRLWDTRSGHMQRMLHGHAEWLYILALSADGTTLASGSKDETVWIWDLEQGQVTHVLRGHTGEVASLAFSPDGTTLASSGEDGIIQLWNVHTGQAVAKIDAHTKMVHWLVFDRTGTILISASGDETMRLWDAQTGQSLHILRGHTAVVCELDLSPDGSTLGSCGSADQTVRLWNLHSGALLHTLQHNNWVVSLAFSSDGATLASGSEDGTLWLWDVQTGACLRMLRAPGPYAGMNIVGATGITTAQRVVLKALGAVDELPA